MAKMRWCSPRTGAATIPGNLSAKDLTASGVVDGNMKVVYQGTTSSRESTRNPLWRYHMSLTAMQYAGRTKTIPSYILKALCGTPDGCEVRLGNTRWGNGNETEAQSVVKRFYYSPADGHWRTNWPNETSGVIENGNRQDAMNVSNTCYFTDAAFENMQDKGDKNTGMQLGVWNGNNNPTRTCELTIIP